MTADAVSPAPGRRRFLPRAVALAAAVVFVVLLFYGLATQAPETTIDDALARGQTAAAPELDLAVLASGDPGSLMRPWQRAAGDGRIELRELRGTPVVLNFWASWCVPCREEAPLLEQGWQRARDEGVLFLGLNMQDVRGDALRFLRRYGQTFPNVRDPSNATARRWGATGIPETFFISSRGEVVGHVIGVVAERHLRQGVAAAVAGRPLGARRGGEQRPTR